MPGHAPSFVSTSLWHTPQACTLMRTCPAAGSGISRSTISKSPPGLEICAACMGAASGFAAILKVAIHSSCDLLVFGCFFYLWGYGKKPLTPNFEDDFQLDGRAERKAGDAVHQAARTLVFSKDVLQQFRGCAGDLRLIARI